MSINKSRIPASDSFTTKHNRLVRKQNEDSNYPLSPTADRKSFFCLPVNGKLPTLFKVNTVELDRSGCENDTKWGFSLRNIQVQYKDGDVILISVIKKLTRNSLAQVSELSEGDQLLSINGISIHCITHENLLAILQAAHNIKLTFLPAKFRMCNSVRLNASNNASFPYLWSIKRFLQHLEIINFDLKKFQINIGCLSGLKNLIITKCNIIDLSKFNDLVKLSKLESLDLSFNQITEDHLDNNCPLSFLTSLTKLYLNSNNLTTIPACIIKLRNLEVLSLVNNKIAFISHSISQLPNLQLLCLDNNHLKSIDSDLSTLPNLTRLSIANNEIDFASHSIRQEEFQAIRIQGNPCEEYEHTLLASRLPKKLSNNNVSSI